MSFLGDFTARVYYIKPAVCKILHPFRKKILLFSSFAFLGECKACFFHRLSITLSGITAGKCHNYPYCGVTGRGMRTASMLSMLLSSFKQQNFISTCALPTFAFSFTKVSHPQ